MTLPDELSALRSASAALATQVVALEQQLASALARIAELEQQRPEPPPFVKPKRPRKKRAA